MPIVQLPRGLRPPDSQPVELPHVEGPGTGTGAYRTGGASVPVLVERYSTFWAEGTWDLIAPQVLFRARMLVVEAQLYPDSLHVRVVAGDGWRFAVNDLSGTVAVGSLNLAWPAIESPAGFVFDSQVIFFPPTAGRSKVSRKLRALAAERVLPRYHLRPLG